jgi:hypothetical protein
VTSGEAGSWETHPDLRRLRRATDLEFREEAAAEEQDAAQALLRRRALGDAAFESMVRGDEVTVAAGGREFIGRLVEATGDLISVETTSLLAHLTLTAVRWLRIDRRGDGTGERGGGEAGSLRARLGIHEMSGEPVEVLTTAEEAIRGRIRGVGRDHLSLVGAGGIEWLVPLPAVAGVMERR